MLGAVKVYFTAYYSTRFTCANWLSSAAALDLELMYVGLLDSATPHIVSIDTVRFFLFASS